MSNGSDPDEEEDNNGSGSSGGGNGYVLSPTGDSCLINVVEENPPSCKSF
ncbi:hypothetical protein [uncultured Croceitalea sp.]